MQNKPLISVIMSVFNEEQYIVESIQSILNQTISDFEIIVYDDCSTDRTLEIIRGIDDDRIHIYQNHTNQGLTKNLNQALDIASGQYIARMDGDDVSTPDRFERQIQYMNSHPDTMLISCQTQSFGEESLVWKLQDDPEKLRCMMLVRPVLAHPGFMFRKELVDQYGFKYDESFRQAQDYELVSRVTRKFSIGICPYVLLKYRVHKTQVSNSAKGSQFCNADRVRAYLLDELGIRFNESEIEVYHKLVLEQHTDNIQDFIDVKLLLERIMEQNKNRHIYRQLTLEKTLREIFCIWVIRNKSRKIFCNTNKIWRYDKQYFECYLGQWIALIGRKLIEIF